MRVWINRRNDELLYDDGKKCFTRPLSALHLNYNERSKTERANFVERWHKENIGAEVTFDGQPWPWDKNHKVHMRDFERTYSFWIYAPLTRHRIPTYLIETLAGEMLILQIYSRTDKAGRHRAHVRIRERGFDDTPSFLILDH